MNYKPGDIIDVYKVVRPVTRDSVSSSGEAWVWREYLSANTRLSDGWQVRYEPDEWTVMIKSTGLFAFTNRDSAISFASSLAFNQQSALVMWLAKGRFLRWIREVLVSPTDAQLIAFWSDIPEERRALDWSAANLMDAPEHSILCSGIKLVKKIGAAAGTRWTEYKESEL
jgi:hypothetical protein